MHVADGLLPAPLCIGGYALGGLTLWWTLRQSQRQSRRQGRSLQSENTPTAITDAPPNAQREFQRNIARAALLTAAFFVASSIRIPIPPASVHFVLVGLLGALLGPLAFPSVVVGLTLQALLVGHGGLTVLGVNAVVLGWPAIAAGILFRQCQLWSSPWLGRSRSNVAGGFLAGFGGTALVVVLFFGLVLWGITPDLNADVEQAAAWGVVIAHLPLVLLEACLTAAIIGFCQRVYPQLLPGISGRSPRTIPHPPPSPNRSNP